jgi:lipooligosaccharide transport system permease protein
MIHPSLAVLEHQLIGYRRVWRGSVYSSFVLPVLFMLGMGLSVGRYVDSHSALGVSYVDYIAPGVLASTAMQVAVGEASWPVLAAFVWTRMYHAMRASPLRVPDVLIGHLAFVLLRVALASFGFLVVMVAFGTVHSMWAVAALPAALLVGLASAAPVFAYSALIKNDSLFTVLFRFGVIPMTLFAGVFFPVDTMPLAARWLAYISPLWHGVELCHAATLGVPTAWGVSTHVGFLVAWCVVGYVAARTMFVKRLVD